MNTATSASSRRRKRWVKVDVDQDVFDRIHIAAARSRLRLLPYLRQVLAAAEDLPLGSQAEPPALPAESEDLDETVTANTPYPEHDG